MTCVLLDDPSRHHGDPVLADFFGHTRSLSQAEIDYLVKRSKVPIEALYRDGDGFLSTIGSAWAVADGLLFDFAEEGDEGASRVLIFVARDRCGDPRDLIAWWPREDRVACHCGRVALLGEHDIDAPTVDPLAVHRSALRWLLAERTGAVIVDPARAWRALDGMTLMSEDVEHGIELRRVLTAPKPRIVVRSRVSAAA